MLSFHANYTNILVITMSSKYNKKSPLQCGITHYRSMDGNKIIAFALHKYYEVMLCRQNTCCAHGNMQMR